MYAKIIQTALVTINSLMPLFKFRKDMRWHIKISGILLITSLVERYKFGNSRE